MLVLALVGVIVSELSMVAVLSVEVEGGRFFACKDKFWRSALFDAARLGCVTLGMARERNPRSSKAKGKRGGVMEARRFKCCPRQQQPW